MAATPILSSSNLVKRWGKTTALDGVTAEFGEGITGLLGSNGAGKTTFVSVALGLHRPDEGSVSVFGLDPWESGADVRGRIGYSPENEAMPGDARAQDFVRHMAEIHGIPRREAVTRASDALWLVGLGEERFRQIGTMSTGQKQMVKLAQAIAHDPILVLLDEPTNGLDPVQREAALRLIRQIGTDMGMNVVVCSHLLGEVEQICDSVTILDAGRVVAGGRVDDLRGQTGQLIVEVDDKVESIARSLAKAGCEVKVDGPRILLTLDGDEAFDLVRNAVAASKAGLIRMERRKTTLEEVFLETGATPDG